MKSKSIHTFLNKNDFNAAIKWIKSFLTIELDNAINHDDPESIIEEIELIKESIENLSQNSDCSEIWKSILKLNNETYHYKREPDFIYWGVWRLDKKQTLKFGYKEGYIKSANIIEGGNLKLHNYQVVPPPIKWKLNEITQKGVTFYTACANVHEIEQVTSVPALPTILTPEETGKRILDSNLSPEEWQRRPNSKRIESIKEFADINDNIIANAPILFVKKSPAVTIKDNELIIDFTKFLIPSTNTNLIEGDKLWCDFIYHNENNSTENTKENSYEDLRPIWLIDGQHRVRGLSRSVEGGQLSIPIIIFPPEFGLGRAAKIFAEINTLQESLKPLHKLFMQHRFQIKSPIPNRNFEEWEMDPDTYRDSRANHLSYELVARLASNKESVLFNKIRLIDQNNEDYYVKADQWLNFSRSWFLSGPYSNITVWTKDKEHEIFHEVNNYFKAFIETVNHDGWDDKRDRWSKTSKRKSILQSSTHFKALIDLFSQVHHRIKKKKSIISVEEFKLILAPFKWVDWIDTDIKKMFGGGGEKGRSSLFIWMHDALNTKESHPYNLVMNNKIKSVAGQGIFAEPKKSEIKFIDGWPTLRGKTLTFISKRPINARRKPTWSLTDDKGETYNFLKINSNEECELNYDPIMDKVKHFKISVIWSNASSINATTTITIKRPIK